TGADQRETRDDVQRLSEQVVVPERAGAGRETHHVRADPRRFLTCVDDVVPDVTGELGVRAFTGRDGIDELHGVAPLRVLVVLVIDIDLGSGRQTGKWAVLVGG